jgi:anthranilate 1,2-dioxygenase ferredoxin subunit
MQTQWIDAAAEDAISPDECLGVSVGGTPVVLVRDAAGDWFALHDLCTHGAARLSDGYVENGGIECPLHQGVFELKTGAPLAGPVVEGVRTFKTRCVSGRIEVGFE